MNIEDQELRLRAEDYSLLTDLYQLTMVACYTAEGLSTQPASFELFVRQLPEGIGYLIAMGLAQVLDYLEKLHFTQSQLDALQATDIFEEAPAQFWSLLAEGSFTGDVWAVPEGTAIFANEPLLRVDAPLWQAQLVETYLLTTINYQTMVATRAARLRDVAGPQAKLLEFGTRRSFGPQASLWAARAALAAGLDATSNVLAALKLGRQPSGTMAHSLVMAIAATSGSEQDAFSAFYRYFPNSVLLIDTYDTVAAAERLAEREKTGEIQVAGVRIDSGDLVTLSKTVRSILPNASIFASGDLDEYEIAKFKSAGACIDGYGLGTRLVTGTPVNGVYKLVEIDGIATMKQATHKVTYPGRKQIYRQVIENKFIKDRLALASESPLANEQPLLQRVMKQGQRVKPPEPLVEIQKRTAASVTSLATSTRQLNDPTPLPVEISESLQQLTLATQQRQQLVISH
ncbi:MAG: nicotinate phosphoribosyltransferase [Coleofasciculus sp. Co-bin14]|nr:nicotinate phosphoribosyltransferase [Coleofasciculus sp. Co-bin14]